MADATIQAIDEPGETFYVLRRSGHAPVVAEWPHPLLEIAPHAVRLPSLVGQELGQRYTFVVGSNTVRAPTYGDRFQTAEKASLRKRMRQLKAWRKARPKRFLRTGRKRNRSALINEETLRAVHRRHWVDYESIRSIARQHWQEWGYASYKSCASGLYETLMAYGLQLHSCSEMTARANRQRRKRPLDESANDYKKRKRRESREKADLK